ncbi:MAG: aldehyde dehydrogenase family protein, partial [Bacillota bacterium]|nr:aldehyde dehydrogenase family protein [Bacillota bacterium]
KARDVVIFSPHPRSKKTTFETVRLMREALEREGAPADILQCLTRVNIPMSKALMARSDLVLATGGETMVRAAYSSGRPAYGVGAGNATMLIDETADIQEAAHNTMLSKTSDYGSGCSADGNLIIEESIFDRMVEQLTAEGGYLANEAEKAMLCKVMWDEEGHRLPHTVAIAPQKLAETAGFTIPEDSKFIMVLGDGIGKQYPFSGEKLTTLLALFKYEGFENGLDTVRQILEVGGRGHSVGIYSFDDDRINQLALMAPVSRIMVRQPQSKANSGSFTNGMPMTSSMGCGTFGGNIVSDNISLKHYMNTTWVSRPIPEDKPSDAELFGDFYDPELEE